MGGTFDDGLLVKVLCLVRLFGDGNGGVLEVGGVARCWVLRDRTSCFFGSGVGVSFGPRLAGLVSVGGGAARMLRTTQWTRASLIA